MQTARVRLAHKGTSNTNQQPKGLCVVPVRTLWINELKALVLPSKYRQCFWCKMQVSTEFENKLSEGSRQYGVDHPALVRTKVYLAVTTMDSKLRMVARLSYYPNIYS